MLGWLSWASNKGEPSQELRSLPSPMQQREISTRQRGTESQMEADCLFYREIFASSRELSSHRKTYLNGKDLSTCKRWSTKGLTQGPVNSKELEEERGHRVGRREITKDWERAAESQHRQNHLASVMGVQHLIQLRSWIWRPPPPVPHPKKAAPGEKITGMTPQWKASPTWHEKQPCQPPHCLSTWGQTLRSPGRPGVLISVHFLKGGTRCGSPWESGSCFLQHTRAEVLLGAHMLLRNEGCICSNENMSLCEGSTDSILGGSRRSIFRGPELPSAPGCPLSSRPCVGVFHLHLPKYAFPSSGLNLALNECRKENTFVYTQIK